MYKYTMLYISVLYSPGLIVQPPTSTVVYLNTQAEFTCQLTTGSLVVWFVNGIESRALPQEMRDDISTDDDGFIEILIITARTQYNNTVVQCVAAELGGSGIERSDNATLRIQGTSLYIHNTLLSVYIIVYYMYMYIIIIVYT